MDDGSLMSGLGWCGMAPTFVLTTLMFGVAPGAGSAQQDALWQGIRADAIRAHTVFLADDLLEGRGTGTRGHEIAAQYVASMFRAAGIAPGAPDGSYFQWVPLRHSVVEPERSSMAFVADGQTRPLEFGSEFVTDPVYVAEAARVVGPAVFVGHGIVAPRFGHDDYAGIDVSGKIVVVLPDAPSSFGSNPAAHFSSGEVKAQTAADHGAIGMVTIWTGDLASRFPWTAIVGSSRTGGVRWVDGAGRPSGREPRLRVRARVTREAADELFASAATSLADALAAVESGRHHSFELGVDLQIGVNSRHSAMRSPNVVGYLDGTDPTLRGEHVVYTAHLDHVGIGRPVDGDSIYNGALDNATGVAALIEVAAAFGRLAEAPARSLYFVATAAEERGLLGADYFARNPPVPIEQIVANVNMDGNLMPFPTSEILAFGDLHSSLGSVANDVAATFGLTVAPDPMPEQTIFIRSDHYPFVRQGVPALSLMNGFNSSDPAVNGMAVIQQWLATRYHSPNDDLSQPILWDLGETYARVSFLTGYRIASDPMRPRWNEGDFFGELFGQSRRAIP